MLDIHNALAHESLARKDSLGCLANRLSKDLELRTDTFSVYRKRTLTDAPSAVATPPSARGFLLGVALEGGHRRRIFNGRRSSLHDFEQHAVYLRDFADDYRADLHGGFDFLLVELSPAFIAKSNDQRDGPRFASFDLTPGTHDPMLGRLAQAFASILDGRVEASPLFVEQLGLAVSTHLHERYAHAASRVACRSTSTRTPRRLSPLHEARAIDMLLASIHTHVSIEDIASACRLSRAHFIRAFKQSMHSTPYQWLLDKRIERARELLSRSPLTIADIAGACGFSDQSHFTRVFAQKVGMPPAAWRRDALR